MSKILILSDIHGNLSALKSVLEYEQSEQIKGMILLGDLIDYGPRSNEVIRIVEKIPQAQLLANIWGNHELAIISQDDKRFSSERGKKCAEVTRKNLSDESLNFINEKMEKSGQQEFFLLGKKCLAIHGSIEDPYWNSISHEEVGESYAKFDFVFSGHSHIPHFFEHFYKCQDEQYRNKKRTIFINPGSVGQPRNHNPNAHYAILEPESMTVQMKAVPYNIDDEIALFTKEIDSFYKERLKIGV